MIGRRRAHRTNPYALSQCPCGSRKYRFTNSIWRASLNCNFVVSTNIFQRVPVPNVIQVVFGGPSHWQLLALLSRPSRCLISRLRFLLRNKRSRSWSRSPSWPRLVQLSAMLGCKYQLVIDTFHIVLLEWRVTWAKGCVGGVSCVFYRSAITVV